MFANAFAYLSYITIAFLVMAFNMSSVLKIFFLSHKNTFIYFLELLSKSLHPKIPSIEGIHPVF